VETRETIDATHTLTVRVAILERELRRWRVVALAAPMVLATLVVGSGWLPAAGAKGLDAPPARPALVNGELSAERFVLRDGAGAVRATLALAPDGAPLLTFFDRDGLPRAALAPSQLSLSGEDTVTAAKLLVTPGGTPALRLEKDGRLRAVLGMATDGTLALGFYGQDGRGRALLDVGADGSPGLTLFSKSGKVAWSAP
jgi:hypothetical protein